MQSLKNREGVLTLGSYVHELRIERGFSLRELSRRAQISLSTLCRLENDVYVPSVQKNIEAIDRLWTALGGDMGQMLQLSRRCPLCRGGGTLKGWTE